MDKEVVVHIHNGILVVVGGLATKSCLTLATLWTVTPLIYYYLVKDFLDSVTRVGTLVPLLSMAHILVHFRTYNCFICTFSYPNHHNNSLFLLSFKIKS